MQKRRLLIWPMVVFWFVMTGSLDASEEIDKSRIYQKINEYVRAVKSQNNAVIDPLWFALYQDEQAVNYMQKNLPLHYYSFKVYELSIRAREVAFDVDPAEPIGELTDPLRSREGEPLDNSERAKRFPLQSEPDNRRITRSSANQKIPDNRLFADRLKHQNEVDNQDQIEIRLRRGQ